MSKSKKRPPRQAASRPWLWIAGIAAVVLVVTAAGVTVAVVLANRSQQAKAVAETEKEQASNPPIPKEKTPPGNVGQPPQENPKPKEQPTAGTLQPVVFLDFPDQPTDWTKGLSYGVLDRELIRQSVLLAARDSLGLTTRDAVLGESPPNNLPESNRFHVTVRLEKENEKTGKFTLERGRVGARKVLATGDVGLAAPGAGNPEETARHAEYYSREHWLDALKKAGYGGKPNAVKADLQVPEATERLLGRMDYLSQFSAVRDLHALIQKEGESPWLLGALVRAYANLGLLTEFHWNSADKVFKARALLYAQRMAIASPTSPWGAWHHAYACAITGLHQAALNDLAKATKLATNAPGAGPAELAREPAWVPLIDAFCRFDSAKLTDAANQEQLTTLAHFLRFIAAEDRYCVPWTMQAAQPVLEESPECYRVYDTLSFVGGVGLHHSMTLAGYRVFAKTFRPRLLEMNGLPDPVAKLARQDAPEADVVRALLASNQSTEDRVEPSWAVLGSLVQETRIVQVARRLEFMKTQWNVPVDDFLKEASPLVADHPFFPLIQSYGLDPKRQAAEYGHLVLNLPLRDLKLSPTPIINAIQVASSQKAKDHEAKLMRFSDLVYRDYALLLRYMHEGDNPSGVAFGLLMCSPYAPIGRAIVIRDRWDVVKGYADDWEKTALHPRVLQALGRQYTKHRQPADAERCLKQCLTMCPDKETYTLLADAYKVQGKAELAKETLNEFLKHGDDTGLDRAQLEESIARGHMQDKDYKAALPHAEAAAKSYALFGLLCASECYEALEDWDRAEAMARALSERYPESCYRWFFFCKRTGHGNVRDAEKLVAEFLVDLGDRLAPGDLTHFAAFYILTNQHAKAADILLKLYQEKPADSVAWFLAILYDELDKKDERDKILKNFPGKDSTGKQLTNLFIDCLSKGEKGALDCAAADALLNKMTTPDAGIDTCYFVGRFLEKRGQTETALQYLERCITAPREKSEGAYRTLYQTLAMAYLRDRGIEPGKLSEKKAK